MCMRKPNKRRTGTTATARSCRRAARRFMTAPDIMPGAAIGACGALL